MAKKKNPQNLQIEGRTMNNTELDKAIGPIAGTQPEMPEEQIEQENVDQQPVEDLHLEKQPQPAQNDPVKQPIQPLKPALEQNLKALREKAERAERERNELLQKLSQYENQKPTIPEEDLSFNLGADELAEGKHISKLQKATQRELKKQQDELASLKQQTQAMLIETRLKAENPDIEKVVNEENLKSLSEMYPEIAQTISSSSDYYSKAKAAYTMIKKLGIHVEDNFAGERELAQKNAAKPRPLASVSPQMAESPLSRANAFANGLTEDLKAQLLKEMEESAKNY